MKPVFKLTCEYCKSYHLHICKTFREQVNGNSLACNDFEIADTFWCSKNSYKIYTVACLNRQNHNYSGCVRCRQGNAMRGLTRQRQLSLFDRFSLQRMEANG
ncbi:MAG: hypothetical protein Q7J15_10890 [Candidatus Desulfaltia sp.]|nr:hypothetical protein [Candidatus Desulfaltia sp.]